MVGVPGRSKACNTCRARKKGCDLQRPVCGQCKKSNLICKGYGRELLIVEHKPTPSRTNLEKSAGSVASGGSPFGSQSDTLNRTAFEVKSFDAFWDVYLPKTKPSRYSRGSLNDEFHKMMQHLCTSDDTLRCTMLALSMSKLGQDSNDRGMIEHGIKLYGNALHRLNAALRSPAQFPRLEVLATCRLLAMYEQLNGFGPSGTPGQNWQKHTEGIQKLVQMRGPDEYSSNHAHYLFIDARVTGGIAALSTRKRTFLADPKWSSTPWTKNPKTLKDELVDIFLQVPAICADFDELRAYPPSQTTPQRGQELVQRCWTLDSQLQTWFRKFAYALSDSLTPDELITLLEAAQSGPSNLDPSIFYRQGFVCLHDATYYWTICLTLYSNLRLISNHFPDPNATSPTPEPYPQRTDPYPYALHIIRGMKFFLHPESGIVGSLCYSFPMGMALMYLAVADKEVTKEHGELVRALNDAGRHGGKWLGRFLKDLQKNGPGRFVEPEGESGRAYKARAAGWFGLDPR